jgi:riboflavin kinase/FMN adenylyltransferase
MKGTGQNPAPVKPGGVLTIGNFDGVHAGHRAMLGAGQELARARHATFTLLTFEPHPAAILRPDRAPAVLTPLEWKLHLLEQFEPSSILVLEDSASLLAMTAEEFVQQFLVPAVGPSVIVEGEDFGFGSGRDGTVDSLRDFGARMGFEVKVVPSKVITLGSGQTMKVSSTSIRGMLSTGQAADASLALGRPYRLLGEVVAGRGKGRQIGFPTLNMGKISQLVPAEGVYAGWVGIADSYQGLFQGREALAAVFSVGRATTFGDDLPLLIEAHVLSGTAHARPGQWMSMDLAAEIRKQRTFTRVEDLIKQISEDCSQAKEILRKGAERRV